MKRTMFVLAAAAALIAAAPPAPGRGDPDTGIDPPIGAAARAKKGIEPLTRPTEELGMADDPQGNDRPAPTQTPPQASAPASK